VGPALGLMLKNLVAMGLKPFFGKLFCKKGKKTLGRGQKKILKNALAPRPLKPV
jgi:hypothetical protein